MATSAADPVLTLYLALDEDLVVLSAETGQSIPALLDWLHSPEIARTVARFRTHRAHQLTNFALHALATIISATPDLIEQRRAATTILKTLSGPATPRRRTRPSDPGPFDDQDDLRDTTDDLDEDDLEDDLEDELDADELDEENLDEENLDDSTEADDLVDPANSDGSANLKTAAAQVQTNIEHQSAAANPPRAASPGSGILPALALKTQPSELKNPLGTHHSAPGHSEASEASEAEQMRIYDNRYDDDYLPPIPQSTGPPR